MKSISDKRRARMREVAPLRRQLIEEAGNVCMNCGHGPKKLRRFFHPERSDVNCHEILNGPLRDKTLGEPCSLLVLCWHCNEGVFTDKSLWPPAKQLALLLIKSPQHYDLERFNWLRNPNAPNYVTQEEVESYLDEVRLSQAR